MNIRFNAYLTILRFRDTIIKYLKGGFMPNRNRKVIENIISKTKIYIVIIAVLMIALAIYDIKTIIPSIIMFVIILWYSIV